MCLYHAKTKSLHPFFFRSLTFTPLRRIDENNGSNTIDFLKAIKVVKFV